jgi:hypothetical protein
MSDAEKNNSAENEIESPVDGPTPDWMRYATSTSSTPSLTEETTPDWLKDIRSGKSATTDKEPAPGSAAPGASDAEPAGSSEGMSDLERLLAEEGINLSEVAEERPEGAQGMSARDWMISTSDDELIRRRVGSEPIAEMAEAAGAFDDMSDLERLLAEEGINLSEVAEERPEGAQGMSARDWMISTSDDELIRRRVGSEPIAEMAAPATEPTEAKAPASPPAPLEESLESREDKMVVEDDLPDWLRDVEEEAPAEPVAALEAADADKMIVEDDLPDWLRDVEEESSFEASLEEPATVFADDADLPDWLRDVEEESSFETSLTTSDQTSPAEALFDSVGSSMDSVYGDEVSETAGDKIIVEDDLPDWLRDVEEEASVEPAGGLSAPSSDRKVSDIGTFDVEGDKIVVEDDLPDWLREVEAETLFEDVAETSANVGDLDLIDEDDLPDWLRDAQEESALEAPASPRPASAKLDEEDLPDWLKEAQEEVTELDSVPAGAMAEDTSAILSADDGLIEEEDLPDWLKEVQEDEPFDSVEISEADKVTEADLPDWFGDVSDEASAPPPVGAPASFEPPESMPEAEALIGEDLPDWLQEFEDETEETAIGSLDIRAEVAAVEPAMAEEISDEDLPDWLRGVEEEISEVISQEESLPSPKAEPIPTPVAEVETISTIIEAAPEEAEVIGQEAAIEPEPEPVATPPIPAPVPALTSEIPDWLKKLRETQDEPTLQPVPVITPGLTPQPMASVQPVVGVVSEPATTAQSNLPADADKRLALARSVREKGEWDKSLPIYESLIASGAHLDTIIEDMRQSSQLYPTNYMLYQIMGDALMKDGRLQNALEAYRQALEVLAK